MRGAWLATAALAGGLVSCTPVVRSAQGVPSGYFPLPGALEKDPTQLAIPKLDFDVVKPEKVALENGVVLYLLQDPAVPLVTVRALVAAGQVDEPADKLGVADLTFELLASGGAGNLSAESLDELLDFHAVDAGGNTSDEYASFAMNVRAEDFQKLFPVWVDMVRRPRFQKDRFDVAVARFIEGIRRRTDSPDGMAARALRKAVFGPNSPFAREPTERTVKAITPRDVAAFHRKAFSPKQTAVLVTGAFDREQVVALVRQHLGDWKGGDRLVRQYPPAEKLTRRVILVPKEVAQAKIRIGGYGYERLSPKEHAFRLATTALGSFGVGRLYQQVRDAKGLAYSAYASVNPGPVTGLFYAGADTRPGSAAVATDEMLSILKALHAERPLTPGETRTAADMFLNSFAFRFDAADKVVFEKALFDLFGYPDDYLDRFRENVAKVSATDATAAAKELAAMDALQIVVVGPPEQLGDLSRFGPVTVVQDVEAFR